MSQISMTGAERVQALMRYGYTAREAAFLCQAALHGGYFLRRQYCHFLRKGVGGTAHAMIEKALVRNHAKVSTLEHNAHVYHLCRRPFYEALGQGENRNRRERQPLTIKNRLMGFDFVLTHSDYRFLATEQEKVAYFSGTLGIAISCLPTKEYRSPRTGALTARYFVDKYPIFLSGTPAVVSFCFVDEGAASLAGFETYLDQYTGLFTALSCFELIYVAGSQALFQPAAQVFERFVCRLRMAAGAEPTDPLLRRMLDHFAARSLFETNQLSSFDRDKLIRLRREQREFSGSQHEALYERWKDGGEPLVRQILGIERPAPAAICGRFSTHLLEYDYGFFGSLTTF
jgi:hypothetical protein